MTDQKQTANDPKAEAKAKEANLTWFGKTVNISLRTLMSFIGIALLSAGATLLKTSPILGLDPFTAVNTGMATILHTSLGVYQLGANFVIFIFVLFINYHMIGIGTIMNMVLVGFEIEWFSDIYHHFIPTFHGPAFIFMLITNLICGLLLFTAGSSLYMAPNLGVAPYDAIAPIASDKLHIKYKTARVIQDICFLIAAVLVHGPVGIASIVTAFFAGPLITFWNNKISTPLVNAIQDFSDRPSFEKLAHGATKATKSGYKVLSNAYSSTLDTQMHLSGYTNQELIKKIQDTENAMQESQREYNSFRSQYRMLIAEMVKRDKHGEIDK